ncbi:MAG: polyhydroxyalkanoic acid system family protein [Betaproteobacteria bacterium]
MSDIKIVHVHGLGIKAAKKAVQKAADHLAEEYDLTSEWEGDTLHFHRSGVEGYMHVADGHVDLDVKLGFLLRPFRRTFEEHIERNLIAELGHQAHERKAATKTAAKAPAAKKKSTRSRA